MLDFSEALDDEISSSNYRVADRVSRNVKRRSSYSLKKKKKQETWPESTPMLGLRDIGFRYPRWIVERKERMRPNLIRFNEFNSLLDTIHPIS